ncbi:MAG: endo alpha-1,4 polygalactosaminidase [Candidatus Micrarchaeota archaeon]|nr:endo alpha-1,4 polygalactosaminidase [Candidatus Micrarchaeota archaeon]
MRRLLLGLIVFAACTTSPPPVKHIPPNVTFQWVLSEPLVETEAKVVDVDAFETTKEEVARLKAQGKIVIGYISVGSWEEWRPDAQSFPPEVIGNPYPGWEGERFLNIKRLDLLAPIMEARLDMIKEKGFDGVEPDNIDLYNYDTGFNITIEDSKRYLDWLIEQAHKRGLIIAQKNAPELAPYFASKADFMLLESGFVTQEYQQALIYIEKNKALIDVEYTDYWNISDFISQVCPVARSHNISVLLKRPELDNWVVYCP